MKVLGNYVLIEAGTKEDKVGDFNLPEISQEKSQLGVVAGIGSDVKSLTTGDKVVFAKYAEYPVVIEGKGYSVVEERDVLVIL